MNVVDHRVKSFVIEKNPGLKAASLSLMDLNLHFFTTDTP